MVTEIYLGYMDAFCVQMHIKLVSERKEGRKHTPSSRESNAVQREQIEHVTIGPWSSRSMTVPSATLLNSISQTAKQFDSNASLTPHFKANRLSGIDFDGALGHVTHRVQIFSRHSTQSSGGESRTMTIKWWSSYSLRALQDMTHVQSIKLLLSLLPHHKFFMQRMCKKKRKGSYCC